MLMTRTRSHRTADNAGMDRPGRRRRANAKRDFHLDRLEARALLSGLTYQGGPDPRNAAIDTGALWSSSAPSLAIGSGINDSLATTGETTGGPDEQPPDENDPKRAGEGTMTGTPQSVSGAYLTDGVETDPGYDKPMSFAKIDQGLADTCAFTAALSAVALSDFNLAADLTVSPAGANGDAPYVVRLFEPGPNGTFQPVLLHGDFNGTIDSNDAKSIDPSEFWPALFQRAYLTLETSIGADYHVPGNALEALTGAAATQFANGPGQTVTPGFIAQTLDAGTPIVASTESVADPYNLDPSAGIVGDHAYTVVGIEVPATGDPNATYLSLRNPWGFGGPSENGMIRVSWSDFETYYNLVTVSGISGPSINHPLGALPTANNPILGPYTLYETQTLGPIDLSAVPPPGQTVSYSLLPGEPGSIGSNGRYTWTPLPGDIGWHVVTVIAESSPFSSIFETFDIEVEGIKPNIGTVSASPTTISTLGTDLLTLTASDVYLLGGTVSKVSFWLQTDSTNSLDPSDSLYLGSGTASTGWSWSGYLGGVSSGQQVIFALAEVDYNGYTYLSDPVSTPLTITDGPPYSVAAVPWTDETQAPPDSVADKTGRGVTEDASGNTRVFWTDSSSGAQYFREYDAFGHVLTSPQQLSPATPLGTLVGLPDGSFDAIYAQSGALLAQRYDPTGAGVGAPIFICGIPTYTGIPPEICGSADASGNLLIVFTDRYLLPPISYLQSQVYVATLSATGAASGPVALSPAADLESSATVAIDGSGVGVIAWLDQSLGAIIARQVTAAGASLGPEFTVYQDPTAGLVDAAVDAQGDFTLAYEGYEGIHAQLYKSDGTPLTGDVKVYTTLGDSQYGPMVAMSGQGWSVIAWNDENGGPEGAEVDAAVYDPQGRPQGTPFLVPNVVLPTTLTGLAFGDNGKVAIEFNQVGLNDPNDLVTDFRLYKVDMAPVFGARTSSRRRWVAPLGRSWALYGPSTRVETRSTTGFWAIARSPSIPERARLRSPMHPPCNRRRLPTTN